MPQVKTEPGETPGFILTDEDGSTYCALCGRDTLNKDAEDHLNKFHCDDPPRFYCNLCPKHYTVRPCWFLQLILFLAVCHSKFSYFFVQQKAHLKKHCMVNHFYTSDEFNEEHPRPGFRAHMKSPGSGGHQPIKRSPQNRRTSTSPVKSMKRPKINHRTNKGHQVTLEDLFGESYK